MYIRWSLASDSNGTSNNFIPKSSILCPCIFGNQLFVSQLPLSEPEICSRIFICDNIQFTFLQCVTYLRGWNDTWKAGFGVMLYVESGLFCCSLTLFAVFNARIIIDYVFGRPDYVTRIVSIRNYDVHHE